MTVGPPLAFPFPSPSATVSTSTTPSSSSSSSTAPTTATSTPSTTPSTTLPITNHYGGGAPPPSTQTCNQTCAIAIPVILLSLLCIGLAVAYFKHRHHKPPLKSAIAAGSASADAGYVPTSHNPGRGTCAERMRSFFSKREGLEEAGAAGQSGRGTRFSTLRQSVRRDPRTRGYVDLEAGREGGHGRNGSEASAGSELTLAEALAEGDSEARKLDA
ncbi:hypothetical protein MMC27_002264 [Xylographa pallens]|nr:hypothetical protein [Xylographa pallens]